MEHGFWLCISGAKSLSLFIQFSFLFYITCYCFPVFVSVSTALRYPIMPKLAFLNTPVKNGLGNQAEDLNAIWWAKRFRGNFCSQILTKILSNVVYLSRDY